MLFRLLLIVALFYLVRSFYLRLASRGKGGGPAKGPDRSRELDLSRFDIEDADYHDLEDDALPPGSE